MTDHPDSSQTNPSSNSTETSAASTSTPSSKPTVEVTISVKSTIPADSTSEEPSEEVVHISSTAENPVMEAGEMPVESVPTWVQKTKTILIGKPRDLADKSVFTHMSLIAFLAWVGLGADGLSSSSYGPAEAFGALSHGVFGESRFLAIPLAFLIVATVFIISSCYSHIIEEFPSGGGGYLVASKLLGRRVGVVSGCALMVDYVLTITTSIAAAGDAVFGLMGEPYAEFKLPVCLGMIVFLIVLNLRGVKESIQVLLPIFIIFLITHIVLILCSVGMHASNVGAVVSELKQQYSAARVHPQGGIFAMIALLLYAYSYGAGTFTGLEAVSNSMTVLREPRVATAKRTMRYMAFSLAFMAGGLIVSYLLLGIKFSISPTMNNLLTDKWLADVGIGGKWYGQGFLWATILSEGLLLIVAAQAGFIDGPRVLANMAHDSWVPRWFANLSERLATHNGVLLMGGAALAALWFTHGNIQTLLTMYSINVFVTFSLSMIGMCRHWIQIRKDHDLWRRRLALFLIGSILSVSILCVSVWYKFGEGGWVTVVVTGVCVSICFLIHRYYARVGERLRRLDETLGLISAPGEPNMEEPDPAKPTAVIMVGNYSGLGIHTLLNAIRFSPGHYASLIFMSSGVLDSGVFKGSGAMESLELHIGESLDKYVDLSRRLGMPAKSYMSIGTDAVDELERLCMQVAHDFPKSTFFAGQLVFQRDTWVHRLLHNQTAISLQRRLQWAGFPMVILPTRVR